MSQQSVLQQLGALSKVSISFVSHKLIFYTPKNDLYLFMYAEKSKEDSCLDKAQIWSTHVKGEMAEMLTGAYMSS